MNKSIAPLLKLYSKLAIYLAKKTDELERK